MVLAKELDLSCQTFLIEFELLMMITQFPIGQPNEVIAVSYISMVLAKELDFNCQTFL
jgi:hypothetical protein